MKGKNLNFINLLVFGCLACTSVVFFLSCGGNGPRSVSRYVGSDGWIGVYVQDLDDELRRYLDIDERHGVLVNEVVDNSPAEEAGLEEEDVIVRFDGKRIRNTTDLTRAVERTERRSRVKVEIVRGDSKRTLNLRVGEKQRTIVTRHRTRNRSPQVFSFRSGDRPWLGVELAELNRDLASYFQAKEEQGILILSVVEDSPAEKAGLRAGDVILSISGERVTKTSHVTDILREYDRRDEIEMEVLRNGQNRKVKVEIEYSDWRSRYEFDRESLENWKRDLHRWKEDVKDWEYGLQDWHHDFDSDAIYDLRSKIRRNIQNDVLNGIEIDIPEIEIELGGIGDEVEREMERLNDELKNLRFDIEIGRRGHIIIL